MPNISNKDGNISYVLEPGTATRVEGMTLPPFICWGDI